MSRLASRRLLISVLAVGVAIVAAGSYGLVRAAASTRDGVAQHAVRFVDPRFRWTIQVPAGLRAKHFRFGGRVSGEGDRITSFAPNLAAGGREEPPMGWLRSFPADGVALQIWWLDGPFGPAAGFGLRPTRLPLRRSSFERIRPYVGGSESSPRYRSVLVNGFEFAVAIWVGPRATEHDRRAIWRVVASLRFPRLHEGTIWQNTYYVLGPASRYPLGSVTLFRRSSLPHDPSLFRLPGGFYLLHFTPGSHSLDPYAQPIYGIEQVFTSPEPPHPTCKVAFDRKDLQFFCPGTDLRWDRTGEAIAAHAGSANWELFALPVTTAEDGNLLITP